MKVVRFEQVAPSQPVREGFRGGSIQFRDLLVGQEGSRDNYALQWVEIDSEYHTPQHRHNFEQIRIMIEGSFGFGSGLTQDVGSVGYFCEGTYYTQSAHLRSITLLLQVGGPSGAGFMSRRQLRSGIEQLATRGDFRDGVYTSFDAQGKKHNQDSYEATWEAVNQKKLVYPKPQFAGPILFEPQRFEWLLLHQGVWQKSMLRVHGRGLSISQIKVAAGAVFRFESDRQTLVVFCHAGSGIAAGLNYSTRTSIECLPGESVIVEAYTESIFWVLGLPNFID
jgi:hypothetical protein